MKRLPQKIAPCMAIGEVIGWGPIPFGDGEPIFPSDRVPAFLDVNPMRLRRLRQRRETIGVPARALESK